MQKWESHSAGSAGSAGRKLRVSGHIKGYVNGVIDGEFAGVINDEMGAVVRAKDNSLRPLHFRRKRGCGKITAFPQYVLYI